MGIDRAWKFSWGAHKCEGGCNGNAKESGCGGTEGQYLHVSVHAVRKAGNSTFNPGLIGSYEGIFSQKLGWKLLYKVCGFDI